MGARSTPRIHTPPGLARPGQPLPDAHSDVQSGSSAPGPPRPRRRSKQRRSWPFAPLLLLLACVCALFSCPGISPLCSVLDAYHATVLAPAFNVAYPHIQPYIALAKPYLVRAQPFVEHGKPLVALVTSVPPTVYNRVILPYYRNALLPRYDIFIAPTLQKFQAHIGAVIDPYVALVGSHIDRLHPYLHALRSHTYALVMHTRPYLVRMACLARQAWKHSHPHFHLAAVYAGRALSHALSISSTAACKAAGHMSHARRAYVDPHVRRIYDKISESSLAMAPSVAFMAPAPFVQDASTTLTPSYEAKTKWLESEVQTLDISTPTTPHHADATVENALSIAETSVVHVSSIISGPISAIRANEAEVYEHDESALYATRVPMPSTTLLTDGPQTLPVIVGSSSRSTDDAKPMDNLTPNTIPSGVEPGTILIDVDPKIYISYADDDANVQAETENHPGLRPLGPNEIEPEFDIYDFLRDLGVGLSDSPSPSSSSSLPSATLKTNVEATDSHHPTPQEKRAHVTSRHTRWQAELDALVRTQLHEVRAALTRVRERAVKELELNITKGGKEVDAKSTLAPRMMARIEEEGAHILGGIEAFLQLVQKRDTASPTLAEKWDEIKLKSEARFESTVEGVHQEVHTWYVNIKEEENAELTNAINAVKIYAGKAQTDLGMDYAWLEDVTYQDWQRYHDLMRTSENFGSTIISLQNSAAPDPVVPALDALAAETENAVNGFAVRFTQLCREGDRLLGSSAIREFHEKEADIEGTEDFEAGLSSEEVDWIKISPIDLEEGERKDISNMIIGKSSKQVEDALQRVPLEPGFEEAAQRII